ncbi:thiol reductant ABC exporter subunit CydC [Alkalicoccus urumqiensis]|uniref:Thiol reductant ABC exporter subunit CydC n=1 Tax=Alkalicoccus urumqiensis TaxID=1548213 RepID=A0A2P6MJ15_ALKUR|nr:thiol reductant ABC exporter subunit CydC [Alkalicoccus urumqiensis]PRO66271.1 thiol reductant ABC exporter subunit CydC [Alkalicoccus urumqiensis]
MNVIRGFLLKEKKDLALSILFGFLAGTGAVALFANSGYLISKAAVTPPLAVLTVTIALLKLFSLTRGLSRYGERLYSHRATFSMLASVRGHFFRRLEPLAPRLFHRYQSGELLSRIVGDVETMQNYFLRVYYPPVVMTIIFLATIAFTLYFSWLTALILTIGVLLTGWLLPALYRSLEQDRAALVRSGRGKAASAAGEFLRGYRELQLYQKLQEKETELVERLEAYDEENARASRRRLSLTSVNQTVAFVVSWSVLAAAAWSVSSGALDGVFLAMLVMISLTVFENTVPMAVYPSYAQETKAAADRLDDVMEDSSLMLPEGESREVQWDQAPAVRFRDVTFTYPGEPRPMLRNIYAELPAGSKTAVVGASGSGKSTLVQLLLRFYLPDSGSAAIDQVETTVLNDASIWEQTNVVTQEQHFFYGTLRSNLSLADPEAEEEEIQEVLQRVHLHYLDPGMLLEEGAENLSGGERQRLSLARVLLRKKKLWLLDEPTSSLDAVTEASVLQELLDAAGDATVLYISHRLQDLDRFDQILVMDNGVIAEQGTEKELLRKNGLYAQMKQIESMMIG